MVHSIILQLTLIGHNTVFFLIIRLPPEFLPVSGPTTRNTAWHHAIQIILGRYSLV